MSPLTPGLSDDAPDELVPDRQVAREFNVTLMTLWPRQHRRGDHRQRQPSPS
jgi:hypothetical protein